MLGGLLRFHYTTVFEADGRLNVSTQDAKGGEHRYMYWE